LVKALKGNFRLSGDFNITNEPQKLEQFLQKETNVIDLPITIDLQYNFHTILNFLAFGYSNHVRHLLCEMLNMIDLMHSQLGTFLVFILKPILVNKIFFHLYLRA